MDTVERRARFFLRAFWPSFEKQAMLRWYIRHESLAASVICTRFGKRGGADVRDGKARVPADVGRA